MRLSSQLKFIIVALAGALVLAACGAQQRPTATTAAVTRGDLVQTVSGSGQVKPAQEINLNFATSGTIAEVRAVEGQQVSKGDVLATLDTADATGSTELVVTAGKKISLQARSLLVLRKTA